MGGEFGHNSRKTHPIICLPCKQGEVLLDCGGTTPLFRIVFRASFQLPAANRRPKKSGIVLPQSIPENPPFWGKLQIDRTEG